MNRQQMMADCPEEFEETLKDIIDHIEDRVNEVKDKLEIKGVADLSNIEDAYDLAGELSFDLY